MTSRDRIIFIVLATCGALAAFWFLALTPKRDQAKKLDASIAQAEQTLSQAREAATQGSAARARYDADYATVARLGKAVPVDDQVPSLLVQLQRSAAGAHVDFVSLKATGSSAPAPTASSGIGAVAAAGSAVKTNGASSPDTASTPVATQAAAATLPPGATVGAAGFPTMPFSFSFEGSFGDMRRFLGNVQRLVRVHGDDVRVNGRLMTIDAFAISAGQKGFPQVKAALSATTYLLPADQGLLAGATPQGPGQPVTAAAGAGGATAAAGGATTTATVTGVK